MGDDRSLVVGEPGSVTKAVSAAPAWLRRAWPWLLLAAWAPILALSNSKWLYNSLWYDPFIYLGGYLNLPAQLRAWGGLYYFSRLAFLLPGYIAYRLFPPLIANGLLHFGHWYIADFALFALLRRQLGLRVALFTAVLIGGYGQFLITMGWDYPDGASAMFMIVALWAIGHLPTSRRAWLWLLITGLALGAGLHTHVFTLVFWPAIGLFLLLVWTGAWSLRRLIETGFGISAGILAVTLLISIPSHFLGGSYLFFRSTFSFLEGGANQPGVVFMAPSLLQTVPYAPWLTVPGAVLLVVVLNLIAGQKEWRAWRQSPLKVFGLVYLAACALLLAVGVRGGTTILNREYYATYIMPFMAIVVGGLLAGALDRLPRAEWLALLGVLLVTMATAILIESRLNLGANTFVAQYGGWLALAVLAAGVLLVGLRRQDFAGLLGLTILAAAINPIGPSTPNNLAVDNGRQLESAFIMVTRGAAAIDARWNKNTWLVFSEANDWDASLISCAVSVCHQNVLSRDYPALKVQYTQESAVHEFQPGRQIVVIDTKPADLEQAIQATGEAVTPPALDASQTIQVDGAATVLSYFDEPVVGWNMDLLPGIAMGHDPLVAQPVEADGSLATLGPAGAMAYTGQFQLPPGRYDAQFTLAAQGQGSADEAAQVEVFGMGARTTLDDKLAVYGTDFAPNDGATAFKLPFSVGPNDDAVEFRVLTDGRLSLSFQRLHLERLGP